MKRFWLLIIFLTVLYPTADIRAADGICACYYDELEYCEYSYVDESGVSFNDASECTTYCNDTFEDTVIYTDFAEDSDSEGGIDVGADCDESDDAAVAIAAATDSSSTSTSAPTSRKLLTPVLSVDIPTVTFSDVIETIGEDGATYLSINYLGDYIAGVYKYLLGISTTIAIVMIMVSGLQWTLGGTSAEAVGKAKTRIKNAITGLVLLLSAYLILFTVNPNLINLAFPKLKMIQEVPLANLLVEISGNTTTNTCKGSECFGASDFQDCMLRQYGGSASEVSTQLVPVTVDYAGHKATYQVHKNVQTKFQAVFDAIAESGTTYDITKSFGVFNWRAVTGQPKYLSNHSWGTAVDINPDTNPYCSSECFDEDTDTECICVGVNCQTDCPAGKYDLPTEVVEAFKKQGFDWLGDRGAGKMQDYMHFDAPTDCTTR